MSTLGISDKLTVYGVHAMGGLTGSVCACKLANTIKDYLFSKKDTKTASKYWIMGTGFLVGVATSVGIATSPQFQKLAVAATLGALAGPGGAAAVQGQIISATESAMENLGPHFKSLSALFCGAVGAALGSWAGCLTTEMK